MDERSEIEKLRRQCVQLFACAIITIILGVTISIPRGIIRRKKLLDCNNNIIFFQDSISKSQEQIKAIQSQIVKDQSEIRKLLNGNR